MEEAAVVAATTELLNRRILTVCQCKLPTKSCAVPAALPTLASTYGWTADSVRADNGEFSSIQCGSGMLDFTYYDVYSAMD